MFRIGEFSKLSKTTVKSLRFYDEVGLLRPEKVDRFTNYRFYTTGQLVKLHYIQSLRQAGLSIEETKQILDGGNAEEILQKRLSELESEASDISAKLSRIEFILSGKEEEIIMSYSATIKEIPECIVFSKRACIPRYEDFMTMIPETGAEVARANPTLKCVSPHYCFTRYLDGEYKEKDINVEFCQAVETFGNETESIKFKKLPAVTVVSVMHKGPYQNLGQAYAFVFKWIEDNGYSVADSPRESYIDGIWNKENEEDWLTEIQVPVLKKD
ncbi:MAG: MerR family transcriptional regulator [Methanocorpusculum sp.]|nr:MerR family transcriptional regulator [Methanocorpusculum sp.]